jgi:hypothetical protein
VSKDGGCNRLNNLQVQITGSMIVIQSVEIVCDWQELR